MSIRRLLPARDYQALKAATRRLVDAAGGPSAAADVTRGAHQHLSGYGSMNADQAERFMPIDVLADLESECGQPVLTRLLARMSGFLLVPMPRADHIGGHLAKVVAKALKETSEVFVEFAERTGDGEISEDDAVAIVREVDEAITQLAALKLQVTSSARAGQ